MPSLYSPTILALLIVIAEAVSGAKVRRDNTPSSIGIGDHIAAGIALTTTKTSGSTTNSSIGTSNTMVISNLTSSLASLAPNATASLSGCLASFASYATANSSWNAQPGHTTIANIEVFSYASAMQSDPPNVEPYTTLCDGWPRVRGTWSASMVTSTYTQTTEGPSIITPFPQNPPSCTINGADCETWWTQQWSCSDSASSNSGSVDASCIPYLGSAPCSQPGDFRQPRKCSSATADGNRCTLYADQMQMHYWPVTRTSYDVCNKTGGTITENPSTAVISGTTIHSPYVALDIPSLYAYDECGRMGTDMTNVIVTVPSSEVSFGNKAGIHVIATSFAVDYGHLLPNHVPASAWFYDQPQCYSLSMWSSSLIDATGTAWQSSFGQQFPACGTIWEDNFQPQLIAPTQINDLQPEWASCTALFGLYDPPIALQQVTTAAGPSLPKGQSVVPSTSAAPKQTPAPTLPSATAAKSTKAPAAESDQLPSATANKPQSTTHNVGAIIVSAAAAASSAGNAQSAANAQFQGNAQSAGNAQTTVIAAPSGGQSITVIQQGNSVVAAAGQTTVNLTPGDSTEVNGQAISVPSIGNAIVVGDSTVALPTAAAVSGTPAAIIMVGSSTITAQTDQPVVTGGSTLSAGGTAAVIDGTTFSVGPSGLVVDGSTAAFSQIPAADVITQGFILETKGSYLLAEESGSTITLSDGEQTTFFDRTFSVAASGDFVLVNGMLTASRPRLSTTSTSTSTGIPIGGPRGSGALATATSSRSAASVVQITGLGSLLGILCVVTIVW